MKRKNKRKSNFTILELQRLTEKHDNSVPGNLYFSSNIMLSSLLDKNACIEKTTKDEFKICELLKTNGFCASYLEAYRYWIIPHRVYMTGGHI